MKAIRIISLALLAGLFATTNVSAQKKIHHTARKAKVVSKPGMQAPDAAPNVSGQPAYLTQPMLDTRSSPNTADPQIPINIKPQRKVRVVPAPPPPGPISPAIPPKE